MHPTKDADPELRQPHRDVSLQYLGLPIVGARAERILLHQQVEGLQRLLQFTL